MILIFRQEICFGPSCKLISFSRMRRKIHVLTICKINPYFLGKKLTTASYCVTFLKPENVDVKHHIMAIKFWHGGIWSIINPEVCVNCKWYSVIFLACFLQGNKVGVPVDNYWIKPKEVLMTNFPLPLIKINIYEGRFHRAIEISNIRSLQISWLCNVSGPIVQHNCHGSSISTHPSPVNSSF